MLIIGGLFLMVRAEPAPVAADAFARRDFREPVPTGAPAARSGRITANVTMADALEVLGAARNEAASAAAALREAAPARGARLRPGSPFLAYFDQPDEDAPMILSGVSIRIDPKTTLTATRRGDGSYYAHVLTARTSAALRRISGEIETSLADALQARGATRAHADTFASLFPEDPRLAERGRKGERFDVVFEVIADERGNWLGPATWSSPPLTESMRPAAGIASCPKILAFPNSSTATALPAMRS